MSRRSTLKTGRTIAESREKLETASERASAHKKIKRKQASRIIFTVLGFTIVAVAIFGFGTLFVSGDSGTETPSSTSVVIPVIPTIEVVDENIGSTGITSRMKEYIGQLESDLREYGYTPVKAVVPSGAIREVDFYLKDHPGFLKTTIDRGVGVTAEDADRMLRYLASREISNYEYIDLRIDGKAYWK